MRGFVPDFHLQVPTDLKACLQLLEKEPGHWKLFAGGTDLMVLFESGKLKHKNFLDLSRFSELRGISVEKNELKIGAMVNYREIQDHAEIQKRFPLLVRCGQMTGAKAIQNRGTLGGNIANASPAADTPPALLAYQAEIELLSAQGLRRMKYSEFHKDYKKSELKNNEIISAIYLPLGIAWTHHYYRKVGTRAFQSISKIALAGAAQIENGVVKNISLGLASVAAMPLRGTELEKVLLGQKMDSLNLKQTAQEFSQKLKPLDDIRSTKAYRSLVVENVTEQFLICLKDKAGSY